MKWVSETILSYPDQVIRDVWVDWSENALSNPHDNQYSVPNGFQRFLGATGSNERSRAVELYRIGLLRGLLVNQFESGNRTSLPKGWALIQADQHVHTRLGYLAYSIGRAMRDAPQLRSIRRAFNILCGIFALQTGMYHNNHYILTVTLFQYLRSNFIADMPIAEVIWNRYLAAAMFCTLHHTSHAGDLLDNYLSNTLIQHLWIGSSDNLRQVTPSELAEMAQTEASISNVSPPKHSLYWIGSKSEPNPRGMYTKAILEASVLFDAVGEIEREAITSNLINPFAEILKPNEQEICVIETLDGIFGSNAIAGPVWSGLMQTLYEGVIEALNFINRDTQQPHTSQLFYAEAEESEDDSFVIDVNVSKVPTPPQNGDVIDMNGKRYKVVAVEFGEDTIALEVRRANLDSVSEE